MKKFIAGALLGIMLGVGSPVIAGEFGITDTFKLGRIADACEKILVEVQAIHKQLGVK